LPASRFGRALVITAEAIEAAKRRKTAPGPTPKPKAATPKTNARKKRGRKPGVTAVRIHV
jgi:hypothetical protein